MARSWLSWREATSNDRKRSPDVFSLRSQESWRRWPLCRDCLGLDQLVQVEQQSLGMLEAATSFDRISFATKSRQGAMFCRNLYVSYSRSVSQPGYSASFGGWGYLVCSS